MRGDVEALADLPIAEAARRFRKRELTSLALAEACLARIEARDGEFRAFVAVTRDRAFEDAAAADDAFARGEDLGILQGIPYGLKDIVETRAIPTTAGSRLRAGVLPGSDATIAARLSACGAVLLGKLATYEWGVVGPDASGLHPPATNPWNRARITGGSSSGCAAAVAGGLLRTSFGTDTGGSVRSPASYCGIVGLKPSFGRVSRAGILPLAPSLDHVGPLSASVAEAAVSFDAIADPRADVAPAASALNHGATGLRVRYARSFHLGDPDAAPDIIAALDEAASILSLQGAIVEEIDLPDARLFGDCGAVILHHEAYAIHAATLARDEPLYGRQVYASLASGALLGARDRAVADRMRLILTQSVDRALDGADALLVASVLQTAPPVADFLQPSPRWTPMRTIAFNLTGHPALALPAGHAADGLPIGMQLVGHMNDEAMLCRIGAAWEAATIWSALRPGLA